MKRILQIIDRLGEWIILTFLWTLTSIFTLGVGMGVSFLALEITLWRQPSDHHGYIIRNYWTHFKAYLCPRYLLITSLPLLGIALSSLVVQFLLSQPVSLLASTLIIGQVFISFYLASVFLQMPRIIIQTKTLVTDLLVLAPIRLPIASILYVLTTIVLLLAPIYLSFALIFIVVPLLVEIHVWIGKRVNT